MSTPRLIHPSDNKFTLYGGVDTVRRAQEWAAGFDYQLVEEGVALCGHGLIGLSMCPNNVCASVGLDHTRLWKPTVREHPSYALPPAFLLTHLYDLDYHEADIKAYAGHWGMEMDHHDWDDWYYPGHTVSVRLTPMSDYDTWPLDALLEADLG